MFWHTKKNWKIFAKFWLKLDGDDDVDVDGNGDDNDNCFDVQMAGHWQFFTAIKAHFIDYSTLFNDLLMTFELF